MSHDDIHHRTLYDRIYLEPNPARQSTPYKTASTARSTSSSANVSNPTKVVGYRTSGEREVRAERLEDSNWVQRKKMNSNSKGKDNPLIFDNLFDDALWPQPAPFVSKT